MSLDGLLRRLLGEDVELSTLLESAPLCARIDPSQLEQVLVNLAVNARDAMPAGGRLVLGDGGRRACARRRHPAAAGGRYVGVSVSDTGHGIAPELVEHLFEPFFTTKEPGRGTGLGLATCYGIVHQCGGHIEVESAPGAGRASTSTCPGWRARPRGCRRPRRPAPRGTETVLLVEDERSVRAVTLRILRAQGYEVLEAGDGVEALALAERHAGPIHLLVADVVMPRMGGLELAERLRALRPETRVLHVSGYVDRAIFDGPVSAAGAAFLRSRSCPRRWRAVREVLDADPRP